MPESINIDGQYFAVNTDFRIWINFQNISTKNKNENERIKDLIKFLSELGLPLTQSACEAVLCFFIGVGNEKVASSGSTKVTFDFEQDSEYIYSAFLTQYGIDLTVEQMHWWKFKALFKALSSDLEFSKIMMYRSIDVKDVPKVQKKFYSEMKKRYALNSSVNKKMTTEEYLQSMKEHIKKRYQESQLPTT